MAKIIQIVGTSGAGKGRLAEKVTDYLTSLTYLVIPVIEPAPLRDFILSQREIRKVDQQTQAVLYTADRTITYFRDLIPALKANPQAIAVSDRGLPDTVVYQGIIGGVSIAQILDMNREIPKPDKIYCLVADGNVAMERIRRRAEITGKAVSSAETAEKISKYSSAYRTLPQILPNVELIDTTKLSEAEVFAQVKNSLDELLK